MEESSFEPAERDFRDADAQDSPPRPPPANPRRKYKRQTTSAQDEHKGLSESDDGSDASMSASEELEMDDLGSDAGSEADEETGLTAKESRKYLQKQRQSIPLDVRIAGDTMKITKEAKKLADQHVLKDLLVNAVLIGLWYIFSLAISIVSSTSKPYLAFQLIYYFTVQQVDVRSRAPRLPLSSIHNLPPHARPVLPRLTRSSRSAQYAPQTATSRHLRHQSTYRTSHDTPLLRHAPPPLRHRNLPRHRPG